MKSIKRVLTFIALIFAASSVFTIASNVSAARLDTHTGIIASYAENRTAYNNSGCTSKANHYLCPADWYDKLSGNSSYVKIKYPITIPLKYGGEKKPIFFTYYFKYSDFHKYADSSTGSFSVPFNSSSWYNKLPGKITYTDKTDNGGTGNGSKCYVSNNNEICVTSADRIGHKTLYCDDKNSTPIMYADYIPADGAIWYNRSDQKDADWHWARASKAWSTSDLHQGKNTVYYAGTDASANYTTGSRTFYYDTLKPICSYKMDSKTGVLQISADDDNSAGGGEYSGLDYFQYRLKKDNDSWGSWSAKNTTAQTININEPGTYSVEVMAIDHAGNKTDNVFGGIIKSAPPIATTVNNTYHTDIDVISTINLKSTSTADVIPTSGYTVNLTIPNVTNQTKTFVLPAGKIQTVWFKWHTPTTAQTLTGTYTIHTASGDINSAATFTVTKLYENTPPNPQGTDIMPNNFNVVSSGGTATPTRSWNEWTYENNAFKENTRTASLSSVLTVTADSHNPTAFISNGMLNMKSGYGIAEKVTTSVVTNAADEVTPCQNSIAMYPEFKYNTYYRLLDKMASGMFQLKPNGFSMYNSRTHFTPVWWQDGVDYVPETYNIDAWTPAGMLTSYSTSTVKINGSVYDDWHVYPKN